MPGTSQLADKMKRYIILIITVLSAGFVNPLKAQQEAMYSQYMFNTLAVNPAYAGSRNVISAAALYRSQWVNMPGAPKTVTFTVDAPINEKKVGLGFQIFNDKIGITNTTGAFASYAYRIRMDKGSLSFGLQAGASQYRADLTQVDLGGTGTPDDIAFREDVNKILVNFGTGVYYNSDKFYVGLSSPQLLNNKLTDLDAESSNAFSGQRMHLFLAAGYVFPLNEDFHLKPSFLVKAVKGAPLEGDINGTLWIKDVLAIGAQYRTSADIGAMVELQVSPQVRIGYAYDRSVTSLVNYNKGSHEIMLRYEFGFEKGKIISPRYF